MPSNLPPGLGRSRYGNAVKYGLKPAAFFENSHKRFGGVWSLRLPFKTNLVFVSDAALAEQVFTADPYVLQTGAGNRTIAEPLLGTTSLIVEDAPNHMELKSLMMAPFKRDHVERYRERMEQIADAEIDSWPLGQEISMLTRMQAIARTVIMETIFGGTDTEDLRTLDAKVENLLVYARKPQNMELVHIAARRGKGFPKGFQRVRDELNEALFTVLARLRSDPDLEKRDDVISMLVLARREDGTALSDQELRDQLVTLLIQGHSSTATGMAWTLERLVRHPQAMERLREEAQSDGREYMNAVLKESLRVRPPLANTSMRKVAQPYRLGEHELPVGTLVAVAIFLIHRNPDVYPDPEAFRPERFLDWKPGKYEWIPFGEGHRHCIGSTFALTEIETVIRTIMRRTRLEPVEQADEKIKRLGIGFSPAGGARMIVRERTPAGAPSQLPA